MAGRKRVHNPHLHTIEHCFRHNKASDHCTDTIIVLFSFLIPVHVHTSARHAKLELNILDALKSLSQLCSTIVHAKL